MKRLHETGMDVQMTRDSSARYDTVVFDLDGTLLDTVADLTTSVNVGLAQEGFPERSAEEVLGFVGNGMCKLIECAVPNGTPPALTERVFQAFSAYYAEHCMEQTTPYQGIIELLETLRTAGFKVGIVSNKIDSLVRRMRKRYFDASVAVAVGEHEGVRRKPAPDMLFEALSLLGSDIKHTLYVGDSLVDLHMATTAGVDFVLVDWGFCARAVLQEAGAVHIVSDARAVWEHAQGLVVDSSSRTMPSRK